MTGDAKTTFCIEVGTPYALKCFDIIFIIISQEQKSVKASLNQVDSIYCQENTMLWKFLSILHCVIVLLFCIIAEILQVRIFFHFY